MIGLPLSVFRPQSIEVVAWARDHTQATVVQFLQHHWRVIWN